MLGSVLFYVVIAVLIFGVLIATHELGHFATAKLLGRSNRCPQTSSTA